MPADLSDLDESSPIDQVEEAKARSFDPVPDGKYHTRIEQADVIQKPDGRRMLKIQLVIVGGAWAGRWLWMNYFLESPQNLGYAKRDLGVMGLALSKWNDLNLRSADLVGRFIEINQKTKGQFSNVYLQRLLTPEEADALPKSDGNGEAPAKTAPDSGQAGDPNDEIPF